MSACFGWLQTTGSLDVEVREDRADSKKSAADCSAADFLFVQKISLFTMRSMCLFLASLLAVFLTLLLALLLAVLLTFFLLIAGLLTLSGLLLAASLSVLFASFFAGFLTVLLLVAFLLTAFRLAFLPASLLYGLLGRERKGEEGGKRQGHQLFHCRN